MPELPEVEFARRSLQKWLGGATIVGARVHDARILRTGTARKTESALVGRRIVRVERRGKWLRLGLDRGVAFSHLGMTGKWVLGVGEPLRFERLRLDVQKGRAKRSVRYVDPRLFGSFVVGDVPAWNELGPDPLHDGIDVDALHGKLARKALPIKPTLLDQKVLAGVGNIQATEALFMAKIDPRRPSKSLTRKEVGALARAIMRTIARTLAAQQREHARKGHITYVEESGAKNPFLVYGRASEPCPRCRTTLKKMTQAGRTTTYCPHCQHAP